MSSQTTQRPALDVALATAIHDAVDAVRDAIRAEGQLAALLPTLPADDRSAVEAVLARVTARREERTVALARVAHFAEVVVVQAQAVELETAKALAILQVLPVAGALPC